MGRPSPTPPLEEDLFLQQSQAIPLTARERQEGYDIDLVHSQPRGQQSSPTPRSPRKKVPQLLPPLGAASAWGAGAVSTAGAGGYSGRTDLEATGATGGGYEASTLGAVGGLNGNRGGIPPDEKYASRPPPAFDSSSSVPKRKKWYLRPKALGALIILLILILALAVGLGVGLRHNNSTSKAVSPAVAGTPFSSTTTRTKSSGTVIPSSVFFSTDRPTSSIARTTTTSLGRSSSASLTGVAAPT
ncbi:hypothetical protein P7C70_g9110, partial [Phenoliferia sp. Uapishka_3]